MGLLYLSHPANNPTNARWPTTCRQACSANSNKRPTMWIAFSEALSPATYRLSARTSAGISADIPSFATAKSSLMRHCLFDHRGDGLPDVFERKVDETCRIFTVGRCF